MRGRGSPRRPSGFAPALPRAVRHRRRVVKSDQSRRLMPGLKSPADDVKSEHVVHV